MSPASQGAGEAAALPPERMQRLRALILDRLIDILENGVPVQKPDARTGQVAEIGRAPAPPAYLSAAIRFLKEQGAEPAEACDDLAALLDETPEFEDEEEGEEF